MNRQNARGDWRALSLIWKVSTDRPASCSSPEFNRLRTAVFWHAYCLFISVEGKNTMLKISVMDSRTERRLVLEGKLIAPWVAEFRTVGEVAKKELNGRELVIDLANVTFVSQPGENALLELMVKGAGFSWLGEFTKYLLQQLTRRRKKTPSELRDEESKSNGG